MTRFSALLCALVCLASIPVFGQAISVDHIDGIYNDGGTDYISPGAVVYHLRATNNSGGNVAGMTNGFEVYGPSSFQPLSYQITEFDGSPYGTGNPSTIFDFFDLINIVNEFSIDGTGADTLGLGVSVMFQSGVPDGFDEIVMTIATAVDASEEGNSLCIDSCYFPPSGLWLWAPGGSPSWNGPLCYEIRTPPPPPIEIANCIAQLTTDHCDLAAYDFDVSDPGGEVMTWERVSGLGDIDPETGLWTYQPSLADVTELGDQIEVRVCNRFGCSEVCHMHLFFTNDAPEFVSGPGDFSVGMGGSIQIDLDADPMDCDPVQYIVLSVSPSPAGIYDLSESTLMFNPTAPDDGGLTYEFLIAATDGVAADTGLVNIEVVMIEPYEIQIEKIHGAYQGLHHMVDVTVNGGVERLAGFDLLISYDATALTFASALVGDVYECGWEYFDYRTGPFGNCGPSCPSGTVRIVGIAETNNGPHHPDWNCQTGLPQPYTLFRLDFMVTDDRTFECMYAPVRFFWMDCGDNSVAYHPADDPNAAIQGVSRMVFDYGLDPMQNIADANSGFPTVTGVQEECLEGGGPGKPAPVQFVDFLNGGVDIVCADSIDDRSDINLNGEPNEIADAVLFSNYFVYGLVVFNVNLAGQVAATDVNADGLTLTVADLVYLTRVIVGDAQPYAKLSPVMAGYSVADGVIGVDRPMGAAYVVLGGDVHPRLLTDNMEMQYRFDGSFTHVLLSSFEPGAAFDGPFLETDGPIVSIELATYEGARVTAESVPAGFAVQQNYPNPFNPTTEIRFLLPSAGDYALRIYNIAGQIVDTIENYGEAGLQSLTWDGTAYSSGVYFYRLDFGQYSETRKMVLLK